MREIKLDYDDVMIEPEIVSEIRSRSECDYKVDGMCPIWAAPMDTVISENNWRDFVDLGINVVLPRTIPLDRRLVLLSRFAITRNHPFISFSLDEANDVFLREENRFELRKTEEPVSGRFYIRNSIPVVCTEKNPMKICIDIADGHMQAQIDLITKIKERFGNTILIMGGNIASPKTYELYEKAGCSYLRVGVGGGSACLTASNTGVYYPLFSLMKDTYEIKKAINGKCKIIADGGIRLNRDIQKALIYADYVMIGSLFNRAIESAGKTTYGSFYWNVRGKKIYRPLKTLLYYGREVKKEDYPKVVKLIKENKLSVWKEFRGMSTKDVQKAILVANGKNSDIKLKTSEGKVMHQKVEYSLEGWLENEIDALRSSMSYCDSRNLEEYKESKWNKVNGIRYNK